MDPWDNEDDGDEGVRRETCWLERRMGDIVVKGVLEDELIIQ